MVSTREFENHVCTEGYVGCGHCSGPVYVKHVVATGRAELARYTIAALAQGVDREELMRILEHEMIIANEERAATRTTWDTEHRLEEAAHKARHAEA